MARRACLAIGVGNIRPPDPNAEMRFGYLDGAVLAARAIGKWALSSGFGADNVRIVDDEEDPVTEAVVQKAVDELFPAGADVVEHMFVAFCGHGLTDESGLQASWLFSDAENERYRVLSSDFCNELKRQGVQRITLISDACREGPKDFDLMRLDSRRGITVRADKRPPITRFDRLVACQDGALGYMVTDQTAGPPGKCIFSGVVADALWGQEPTAIDEDGRVTTAKFAVCIETRTIERAKGYHLELFPDCSVHGSPAVLYDPAAPPQGPPTLQPWPAAGAASVEGASSPPRVRRGFSFNRGFGLWGSSGPHYSRESFEKGLMFEDTFASDPPPEDASPPAPAASPAAAKRKRAARNLRRSFAGGQPAVVRDDANIVVYGRGVAVWSAGEVRRDRDVRRDRMKDASAGFGARRDPLARPALVEFEDGAFVPVVSYQGLFAAVQRKPGDDAWLAYGHRAPGVVPTKALDVITRLASGKLAVSQIDRLAGELRQDKHADPAMGAICAHLYRAVADVDSIRRMAWIYATATQPVPFDIALLGEMKVSKDEAGALHLHIPKVEPRDVQPGDPPLPSYVTRGTEAAVAMIGGRCPWLGLGWDYVGLVRDEAAPLVEGLAAHAAEVAPRGFTVLPKESGHALAELWGLPSR